MYEKDFTVRLNICCQLEFDGFGLEFAIISDKDNDYSNQ